jgi:hypothetical protein
VGKECTQKSVKEGESHAVKKLRWHRSYRQQDKVGSRHVPLLENHINKAGGLRQGHVWSVAYLPERPVIIIGWRWGGGCLVLLLPLAPAPGLSDANTWWGRVQQKKVGHGYRVDQYNKVRFKKTQTTFDYALVPSSQPWHACVTWWLLCHSPAVCSQPSSC